jgi:hypothetical protein
MHIKGDLILDDEDRTLILRGVNLGGDSTIPCCKSGEPPNVINAFHWYNEWSVFTKSFHSWFTVNVDSIKIILGIKNVIANFTGSLAKGSAIQNKKWETCRFYWENSAWCLI